jgi:outer membrane protein, heavy metal efflux system
MTTFERKIAGRLAVVALLLCPALVAFAQQSAQPIQPPIQQEAAASQVSVPGQAVQESLTWDTLKARFEAVNPQLQADALSVEEARAQEITAFLRPNPTFSFSVDGTQFTSNDGHFVPFRGTDYEPGISYLWERDNKRHLRLDDAKANTSITASQHLDLVRNLTYNLRNAYVQTLQAKAVLKSANDDLEYYDKIIDIAKERYKDGDIAQIDLDRIELLRVQYESEQQSAIVNLRTAKITLLQLLNDRTPVDNFDVTGIFDWSPELGPLNDFHTTALQNRPDLKAALQQIEKSKVDHKLAIANGSTDPTFAGWYTYNPSTNNPYANQTIGVSVNIPLRFFDRNQGEKKRTQIDIERSQKSYDQAQAAVFSDVDSSYAQVYSDIALLKPYKAQYLEQATRVRSTITYSYQHGGASLMEFLNAQSDYRVVQLAYLQLVGSYLNAASQLNLAVGREVIP